MASAMVSASAESEEKSASDMGRSASSESGHATAGGAARSESAISATAAKSVQRRAA